MVYLRFYRDDERKKESRAAYASQAEAEAQADHNLKLGCQFPIAIEDAQGKVLKSYGE